MCAQASCVKQHLCTIPKFQFIYYYSLGHSRFGRCLATLKQLKARATGSLTEDMSLGKMLTVYMTLNWQNPDPNFLFFFPSNCAQLLQSIPLEKVSSRQFFLNGQDFSGECLCWAYCGSLFLATLPFSLSLLVHSNEEILKNFKYWWVAIYHVPLLD